MADPDVRQAMVDRFAHAAEVCRVCSDFRRSHPCLPDAAERAAVALKLTIPQLRERLAEYANEEKRHAR